MTRAQRDAAATRRLDRVMTAIGDDPDTLVAVISLMDRLIARRERRKEIGIR